MDNREALRERLKAMGVKNAGMMAQVSQVASVVKNPDAAQKIRDIQSGASRDKMTELMNVGAKIQGTITDSGLPIAGGEAQYFAPIPTSKRRRPGQPVEQVNPKIKEELEQSFNSIGAAPRAKVEGDAGFDAINSMFDEHSRRSTPTMPTSNGNRGIPQQQPVIDLDNVIGQAPSFESSLNAARQKIKKKAENPFLNYAQEATSQEYVQEDSRQQNVNTGGQINIDLLKTMMESIAKGIAEQTMKNVLDSYMENKKVPSAPAPVQQIPQQQNGLFIEYYAKEKNTNATIVKDSSGQYYKLIPVRIK